MYSSRNSNFVLCRRLHGDPGPGGRLRGHPLPHVHGRRTQRRRRGDHQGQRLPLHLGDRRIHQPRLHPRI